jgi:hypothetical protein
MARAEFALYDSGNLESINEAVWQSANADNESLNYAFDNWINLGNISDGVDLLSDAAFESVKFWNHQADPYPGEVFDPVTGQMVYDYTFMALLRSIDDSSFRSDGYLRDILGTLSNAVNESLGGAVSNIDFSASVIRDAFTNEYNTNIDYDLTVIETEEGTYQADIFAFSNKMDSITNDLATNITATYAAIEGLTNSVTDTRDKIEKIFDAAYLKVRDAMPSAFGSQDTYDFQLPMPFLNQSVTFKFRWYPNAQNWRALFLAFLLILAAIETHLLIEEGFAF